MFLIAMTIACLAATPAAGEISRRTERCVAAEVLQVAELPAQHAPHAPQSVFAWEGNAFRADAAFARRWRALPESFETTMVVAEGETLVVDLERLRVVDEALDVRLGDAPFPAAATAMRELVQYRGRVRDEAGSLVHLAVSERGAAGFIDRGPGRGRLTARSVGADDAGLQSGMVRFDRSGGTSQPEVPLCATSDEVPGGVAGFGSIPPGAVATIDIAVDSDFEFYSIFGDPVEAGEYVAAMYGAISAIYRRDADATIHLTYLRLFDTPDDLFNEPDPLGPFRSWWNENQSDVPRDVAQLLTGRRNLPYGGVAYLNAACGQSGYSVNGYLIGRFADPLLPHPGNWDLIVVAHELGHNVGTHHTHVYGLDACDAGDVQRGSIMSYCHVNSGATANIDLRLHRFCADAIEAFLVSAECIASDCDGDGIADDDAILSGIAVDLNGDGVPDACQDCDADGIPDPLAIVQGLVADVDGDGRPDICEPDCDANGLPDSFDIAFGAATDAFGDGIPDTCEVDCDGDGVADYSQIQADMSLDRSRDGRLDACEDCDGDGVADFVELAGSCGIWVGGTDDGMLRELHPRSGVMMTALDLGADPIHDLVIAPDELLYASAGHAIVRIDRAARTVLGELFRFPGDTVARGLACTSGGVLLVATSDNEVVAIDTDRGALLGSLIGPGALSDPHDVTLREDGRVLVSCGDGRVHQYDMEGNGSVLIDRSAHGAHFAGVIESPDGASVLVVDRAQGEIRRFDGISGADLGRFDVQASDLLAAPWGLAASADGRAVVATSASSSSTVNGYRFTTGYLERTYRVYGTDAPGARAIAIAPPSATDRDGDLVPDSCQAPLGDLDGDGVVGPADLAMLLGAWGASGPGDLDGDGVVGAADLAILLGNWTG